MRSRPSLIASAAMVLAALILGAAMGRPSRGQANPADAGRFAMRTGGINGNQVVVTDTRTGHTWARQVEGTGDWRDFGVPPSGR